MNKKLFSIVVPLYNGEKYIARCIESLEIGNNQEDFDIIIINDGSTDKSDYIVKENLKKYKNIKYKYISNAGVSNARNVGISLTETEYIMFCDCDDEYEKATIQRLKEYIENLKEEVEYVAFNRRDVFSNGKTYDLLKNKEIKKIKAEEYIIEKFSKAKESCFTVTNKLYRMDIIKNNNILFPVGIKYSEDVIFNFDYLKYVKNIIEMPNIFYIRYYNKGSAIVKSIPDFFQKNIDVVEEHVMDSYKDKAYKNEIIKNLYIHFAFVCIDRLVKKIDYLTIKDRATQLRKIKKICNKKDIKLNYNISKRYSLYSKTLFLNEYIFLVFLNLIFFIVKK